MHAVRRSLIRFAWMALLAMLAVAIAPTTSRLLVAGDPVRAALLSEICSVGLTAVADPSSEASDPVMSGGGHCPVCLSAAVAFGWPEPDRRADYTPPVRHLRPATASLQPPGQAPVWPSAPSRAPPSPS